MSIVAYPDLTVCAGCDQPYARQDLSATQLARCRRCGSILERGRRFSISTWLALTLTAAIAMVFANVFPVAVISLGGLESEATVWQSVVALAAGPGAPVAVAAGIITIGVPALQVLTLLWLLSFAVAGRSCPGFVPAMRVLRASRPWGMIEVCSARHPGSPGEVGRLSACCRGHRSRRHRSVGAVDGRHHQPRRRGFVGFV